MTKSQKAVAEASVRVLLSKLKHKCSSMIRSVVDVLSSPGSHPNTIQTSSQCRLFEHCVFSTTVSIDLD